MHSYSAMLGWFMLFTIIYSVISAIWELHALGLLIPGALSSFLPSPWPLETGWWKAWIFIFLRLWKMSGEKRVLGDMTQAWKYCMTQERHEHTHAHTPAHAPMDPPTQPAQRTSFSQHGLCSTCRRAPGNTIDPYCKFMMVAGTEIPPRRVTTWMCFVFFPCCLSPSTKTFPLHFMYKKTKPSETNTNEDTTKCHKELLHMWLEGLDM